MPNLKSGSPGPIPRLAISKDLPTYTTEELRKRILNNEYLTVVDGYVLKLNALVHIHPGGPLALMHAIGKDATDEMHAMHPDWVFQTNAKKYIVAKFAGDFDGFSFVHDLDLPFSKPTPIDHEAAATNTLDYKAIQSDYQQLHQHFRDIGLFKCNFVNYLIEGLRFLFFAVGVFGFILIGEITPLKVIASSICAAGLWHQAAFTAHDLGHSAVTANRVFDTVTAIFLGDILGGLSLGWWKKSHNVHHIVTNQPENDPDIQHLPFLAISPVFFNNLYSTYYKKTLLFDKASKILVVIQHKLYYIIMIFGRFNLYVLSWSYVLDSEFVPFRYVEILCLSTFWTWYGWLLSHLPTWNLVFLHIFLSHALSGILHVQLTLSHFGMPVTSPDPVKETFMAAQIRTSLNVICPKWFDWFHGGLQFQIEHHLFPRLPRHNLRKAKPYVIDLCNKHGMKYVEDYFLGANIFTIGQLKKTAETIKALIIAEKKVE
ncbi:hypothetical protein BB558_002668 [Smittium angustum]|uniref:Cytochrome b5 heme-binding domain-containing protein n=1 Tax=Smittium angustum TaxID=133377 RepID=A0A2U1J880_SMIAN|nr:hypothetical protein BB558_002668 [Smittium angustum]